MKIIDHHEIICNDGNKWTLTIDVIEYPLFQLYEVYWLNQKTLIPHMTLIDIKIGEDIFNAWILSATNNIVHGKDLYYNNELPAYIEESEDDTRSVSSES